MFSEMIKIVPQMDRSALNRMFQNLTQRFATVAKKFSRGLKNAMNLRNAGIIAFGGAILSKLLNPLEKAEAIMDRLLTKGDDAVGSAQEFGSDPGKLLRLEALGRAKGLDAETMRSLLSKFQTALAQEQEAAKDPKAEKGLLREFVGETDTADAFFKFIQSLQALDKSRQVVVQSEIFGEKIRGKASEFFNTKPEDFAKLLASLPASGVLSQAAKKTSDLSDLTDELAARRELEDLVSKADFLNEGQVRSLDQIKRKELSDETKTLTKFDVTKETTIAVQELTSKVDKLATQIMTETVPVITKSIEGLTMLLNDVLIPLIRGIKSWLETAWAEFKTSRVFKFFGGK